MLAPELEREKYFSIVIHRDKIGKKLIDENISFLNKKGRISSDKKYEPWQPYLCAEIRSDCGRKSSLIKSVSIYRLHPSFHDRWSIRFQNSSKQELLIDGTPVEFYTGIPQPIKEDLSQGEYYLYDSYVQEGYLNLPPVDKEFELILYNDWRGKKNAKFIVCMLCDAGVISDDAVYDHWNPDVIAEFKKIVQRKPHLKYSFTLYKMHPSLRTLWNITQNNNREILTINDSSDITVAPVEVPLITSTQHIGGIYGQALQQRLSDGIADSKRHKLSDREILLGMTDSGERITSRTVMTNEYGQNTSVDLDYNNGTYSVDPNHSYAGWDDIPGEEETEILTERTMRDLGVGPEDMEPAFHDSDNDDPDVQEDSGVIDDPDWVSPAY